MENNLNNNIEQIIKQNANINDSVSVIQKEVSAIKQKTDFTFRLINIVSIVWLVSTAISTFIIQPMISDLFQK